VEILSDGRERGSELIAKDARRMDGLLKEIYRENKRRSLNKIIGSRLDSVLTFLHGDDLTQNQDITWAWVQVLV